MSNIYERRFRFPADDQLAAYTETYCKPETDSAAHVAYRPGSEGSLNPPKIIA
jgi:hypothetical protein